MILKVGVTAGRRPTKYGRMLVAHKRAILIIPLTPGAPVILEVEVLQSDHILFLEPLHT
jgi:hypothetical protein